MPPVSNIPPALLWLPLAPMPPLALAVALVPWPAADCPASPEQPTVFEKGRVRDELGVRTHNLQILHNAMLAETEDPEEVELIRNIL